MSGRLPGIEGEGWEGRERQGVRDGQCCLEKQFSKNNRCDMEKVVALVAVGKWNVGLHLHAVMLIAAAWDWFLTASTGGDHGMGLGLPRDCCEERTDQTNIPSSGVPEGRSCRRACFSICVLSIGWEELAKSR